MPSKEFEANYGRLKGNPELARELAKLSNDSQRKYKEWIEASLKDAGKEFIPEYLKPAVKAYYKGEATAKERAEVIAFLSPAGTPKRSSTKKSAPGMTYKQALNYIKEYAPIKENEELRERIITVQNDRDSYRMKLEQAERTIKDLKAKLQNPMRGI